MIRWQYFVMLVCVLGVSVSGCAMTGNEDASKGVVAPAILLNPSPNFEADKSYQRLVSLKPVDPSFESAKIDYLLNRIKESNSTFIRNNQNFEGRKAMLHLKWKYWKRKKEVLTAEDFIEKIATRSKMSGDPYLVHIEHAGIYPLKAVLKHELEELYADLKPKYYIEALNTITDQLPVAGAVNLTASLKELS